MLELSLLPYRSARSVFETSAVQRKTKLTRSLQRRRLLRVRRRRWVPLGGALKRVADIAISATALMVLMPVLASAAIWVRQHDGGPAFYSHRRVGYRGRTFNCLKLRSMVANADDVLARHLANNPDAAREWHETFKLKNDPRITPLGSFLRRTSLDEIPQLINVLRGDMSIVGPRPVTQNELSRYGSRSEHYLATRPGITGLWQVSGRNDVSYERRVELDAEYVRAWSIASDVRIMLRTVPAVFQARGTY